MKELEKLLNSLKLMNSISIINNVLSDLYRKKKSIEEGKELGLDLINYETIHKYLLGRINFWEINKDNLFKKIMIMQNSPSDY